MACLHTTHFFFLRLCTTTPQLNSILHRRHLSLIASVSLPRLAQHFRLLPATSRQPAPTPHTPTPLPRKTPTRTQPTGSEADEKLTALVDGLPTTSTLLCSSSEMLGRRDGTCPGLPDRQTDMEKRCHWRKTYLHHHRHRQENERERARFGGTQCCDPSSTVVSRYTPSRDAMRHTRMNGAREDGCAGVEWMQHLVTK